MFHYREIGGPNIGETNIRTQLSLWYSLCMGIQMQGGSGKNNAMPLSKVVAFKISKTVVGGQLIGIQKRALLVVYVDDFNLSAPAKAHDRLWKQLRAKLNLEEPSEPNRFLGCYKRAFTAKAKDLEKILQQKPELYPRAEAERGRQRDRSLLVAWVNMNLTQRCGVMCTTWMSMSERTTKDRKKFRYLPDCRSLP